MTDTIKSLWTNFPDPTGCLRAALAEFKPPTTKEELRLVAEQLEQLARRLRLLADEVP